MVQAVPLRVGLLGGECTGKTTLAGALAETLPACVAPESLRAFVARNGRPPRADEQAALLDQQHAAEESAAADCRCGVLVVDPAPLMTAVYSEVYFADASLTPRAIELALEYDLLVWCAPDLPWVPDPGLRDGAQWRTRADEVIARIVRDELRPRGARILLVSGSTAQRMAAVVEALARTPEGQAWQPGAAQGST